MTTDPLQLLRDADPATSVAPYSSDRAATLLDRAVAAAPGQPTPSRQQTRRAGAAAAGFALVLCGGGVAWAVLAQPPATALQVLCAVGIDRSQYDPTTGRVDGSNLQALSGDPVADCAGEFQRLQGAAPPLTGYDTGGQQIAVMPADWPAPADWKPLPTTFRNDPTRLELKHRLDDLVEGPQGRCATADETERIARAELADLGLTGWTFRRLSQAHLADGRTWCASAWVDEGPGTTIVIQATEGGMFDPRATGNEPTLEFIATLRSRIVESCEPLSEARRLVEDTLVKRGLRLDDAHITTIEDPGAACTRVDFVPGGNAVVILRGPRTEDH
jgi:hypothetical protein